MIGWERIDMCTVVPYEYMAVGGVLNGLIYLILSSPTRVDAVWRALRPFEEGEKLLLRPLTTVRMARCVTVSHSVIHDTNGLIPQIGKTSVADDAAQTEPGGHRRPFGGHGPSRGHHARWV